MTPASIIPVLGSRRPYADLNFAAGSFGVGGQIVSDITRLPGFTFTRASTAMFYGSNGLLQTAGSGVARLAYDPVTLASQGILVEEARTNLALQSQTFSTTWITADGTLTANDAVAPDGTTTADKLVGTAATAQGRLVQNFTGSIGATYTLSCYVKSAGGTLARLYFDDGGVNSAAVTYNSITGAVSSAASVTGGNWTAVSSAAQQLSNGWWRFSLTFTATAVAPIRIALWHRDVSDGTNGIYFWQAQLEAGTGASSPIPTTTASVTRAADVAAVTGLALSYPMTVAVEAYRGLDKATDEFWVQVDDGTSTNRVVIEVNPSDKLEVAMTTGGAGQGSSTSAASVAVGATSKAAARLATNSIASALNGTLSPEDTTATTPSGPANLRIGSNQSGQAQPMYPISRIRIYNRALSNAELQALTL